MSQLSFINNDNQELFPKHVWTVSELTVRIKRLIESDGALWNLRVTGEVSNLSRPASGHIYFTLKDSKSVLKCVMWRNDVLQLDKLPNNGDAVEVHGSISVYEAAGQYQLYADEIHPIGQGLLFQRFLELKEKLEKEGLFDKTYKRQIPYFPHIIGIVTSTTGAAIQDILRTIIRRYPLAQIVIAPTQVQGEEAPKGIITAIKSLNEKVHPDVIILARGGGAIEDLWAFNDENVARAIFNSKTPVITGVGHETDFTIADFVSDLRAPTPTAAAELAVPNREDLKSILAGYKVQFAQLLANKLTIERQYIKNLINILHQLSPQNYVRYGRQKLDEYIRRMDSSIQHKLILEKSNIENIKLQINVLNPLAILERGYAIVTTSDNQIVHSVKQIILGEQLTIRVSDGKINASVKDIETQSENDLNNHEEIQ